MPSLFDAQGGPAFSPLGMILGGRGYAANWFAQRDQMMRLQAVEQRERGERGSFAKSLVGSPEFKAAMANPEDRTAQYGLWALAQSGPEALANAQVSYLSSSLNDIAARQQSAYSSALQAGNIKLSADEQLRVDQVKRDRDNAAAQRAGQLLFGNPDPAALADTGAGTAASGTPGAQPSPPASAPPAAGSVGATQPAAVPQALPNGTKMNEFDRNLTFDTMVAPSGFKRPDNMSVNIGPNNEVYFTPTTGTKEWHEMMSQITPRLGVIDNLTVVRDGIKNGNLTAGQYDAYRLDTLNQIRAAEKTGALDEGSVQQFEQLLPKRAGLNVYGSATSGTMQTQLDRLDTYINVQRQRVRSTAAEYAVPANQVPRINAPNYTPQEIPPFDPNTPTPGRERKAAPAGKGPQGTEFERGGALPAAPAERRPSALETFREQQRVKREMERF
jgi:hypothetical protein